MNSYKTLVQRIQAWYRWFRIIQTAIWSLRGVLVGATIALAYSLFQLSKLQIVKDEVALWLILSSLLGATVAALYAMLRPVSLRKAAIAFDFAFDLKERASTAVELNEANTPNSSSWQKNQLADTLSATENFKSTHNLPWKMPWGEIFGVLLLVITVGTTWIYGEPYFEQAEQLAQQEVFIGEQIEVIEELIEEIKADEALTPEEIELLISPLEDAIEALAEAETLEETVSVLNETLEIMDALSEPGQAAFEDLKEAGESLLEQEGSPLENVGEELADGNLTEAAEALSDLDLSEMDASEQEALAEQLSEMAETLAENNPALAESLQQAAEALEAGDTASAQESLQSAEETLTETLESFELSEAAAESAETLSQAQMEALQQAESDSGSATSSSQGTEGNGENGTDGEGTGGGEAGRGEFTEAVPQGSEAGLAPIEQDNGAGDGGEINYDSIYSPKHLGGEDSGFSEQPSSEAPGDTKIGETDSSFEEGGTSTVPYSDVYSDYEAAIQAALENGFIPPALRPLVRDYFSSLAP